MIKPQTSTLSYTRRVASVYRQTVVQTRVNQSEGPVDILAVCPQVSLISCEPASGRINYSGKMIFTILYSDDEGKLCRMQKGAEFSHYCDGDDFAPAQTAVCSLSCEKVSFRREGSAIVLSAVVGAHIEVFAPAERSFIGACEGAYLKLKPQKFASFVTFEGQCEVEDSFEADGVEDVLVPSASALVTEALCGTGEIEVSGEINLSLLAVRRGVPVAFERVIPFRCAIVCDDAFSGALPRARAEVRDMTVNAVVDDEHGRCRIEFSCTLAACGYFAATDEQPVACDAFSPDFSLKLTRAEESDSLLAERKLCSERITSPAVCKAKLDFTCRFLAVALPSLEYEYSPESGAAEGVVNAVLLYEQGGDIKSAGVSLPFSVRVGAGEGVSVSASVCGISLRQPAEGALEGEALVKVAAEYSRTNCAVYLTAMEEGAALPPEEAALSIIVPAPGDGLWDAAKKLNCPPEAVSAANPDLKYPLTGGERVLIYRRKEQ